jgi:cyclopropane-fatty-acyl-phospholipid synthase
MNSRIYSGEVMHYRGHPVKHTLKYPVYFYRFDLDELSYLSKELPFFSLNKFNVSSLKEKDYLSGGSIKENILKIIKDKGIKDKVRRVELVTSARYFNYAFNPVSFYYCYGAGEKIISIVAEVNNTFGEKHIYLLSGESKSIMKGFIYYKHDKEFHVSPFNSIHGSYEFFFSEPSEKFGVFINLIRDGEKIMTAKLSGEPLPLTSGNHLKTISAFSLTTFLTVPRIYKEAFKLFFLRKLKYVPKPAPQSSMTIGKIPPSGFEKFAEKMVTGVFSKIKGAFLEVIYPEGNVKYFGDKKADKKGTLELYSWKFYSRVLINGDIGFGESFTEKEWDSPDTVGLIRIFIEHLDIGENNNPVLKSAGNLINRILHRPKRNTLSGSRKNITAHYDLGNDFFKTFLDKSLFYSCGIYNKKNDTLSRAQMNKVHKIIEKAHITSDDHILEIGSGWGGFALEAVKKTGCKVTTITLSQEQHDYVKALIKREKLEKNIKVLVKDYRDMDGAFDKIVSIEMLEAVGHENLGSYFKALEKLLKPRGIAVLQVITTPDHHYKDYRKRIDWIQKHIFPGGHLPSVTALSIAMAEKSELFIENLLNIGPHYALTLKQWRENFAGAEDSLLKAGYDEIFQRKWFFYLAVCEAGFASRIINDVIITLTRQGNNSLPEPGV